MVNERLLVVAFEGWNDAGEAATGALRVIDEVLGTTPLVTVDPELYFDYQFSRPQAYLDESGARRIRWPSAVLSGPQRAGDVPTEVPEADPLLPNTRTDNEGNIFLLVGAEPSRSWQAFISEILDAALAYDIGRILLVGALLSDAPHTRPITVEVTSENAQVRSELDIERSTYEGPVGVLTALGIAAEAVGIETISVWAQVPHYVHNSPSPKAVLALLDTLEEHLQIVVDRGNLMAESEEWERGVDALAAQDSSMAEYIRTLESARDTVTAPEASGEAIAQEFQRYLDTAAEADEGETDGTSEGSTDNNTDNSDEEPDNR